MNKPLLSLKYAVLLLGLHLALPCPASIFDDDWDREEHEEPAGGGLGFFFNGDDNIYGISYGSGVWVRGTPVFGDYFMCAFLNDIEDATYSGVGMSFRIMPHWTFAPFIGAGGSYNLSFKEPYDDVELDLPDRGGPYWAGHAEAGFRIWVNRGPYQYYELIVRQTWSSLEGDRDYWTIGLSLGQGAREGME